MKPTLVSTTVLALALATATFAQSAPASGAAAPATTTPSTAGATTAANSGSGVKVGIIDVQQAIFNTNEGARDFEGLNKKFEPKKTELSNLNTEIENLKKQLNTQGDKMNEETRGSLVKSIESKQKSLQRSAEDAQKDYEEQRNEIAGRILQKMAPIIDKYARTNSYGLLLDSEYTFPQGPLLWANATVDLTKNIVDAYNAQSNVPPPAAAPRPAGAPGANTGKPLGSAAPAKPASAAAKQ